MDNEPMISKTTPESAGSTHPSVRQSNIELLRIIGMLLKGDLSAIYSRQEFRVLLFDFLAVHPFP